MRGDEGYLFCQFSGEFGIPVNRIGRCPRCADRSPSRRATSGRDAIRKGKLSSIYKRSTILFMFVFCSMPKASNFLADLAYNVREFTARGACN